LTTPENLPLGQIPTFPLRDSAGPGTEAFAAETITARATAPAKPFKNPIAKIPEAVLSQRRPFRSPFSNADHPVRWIAWARLSARRGAGIAGVLLPKKSVWSLKNQSKSIPCGSKPGNQPFAEMAVTSLPSKTFAIPGEHFQDATDCSDKSLPDLVSRRRRDPALLWRSVIQLRGGVKRKLAPPVADFRHFVQIPGPNARFRHNWKSFAGFANPFFRCFRSFRSRAVR
jgi:hypothetical protein